MHIYSPLIHALLSPMTQLLYVLSNFLFIVTWIRWLRVSCISKKCRCILNFFLVFLKCSITNGITFVLQTGWKAIILWFKNNLGWVTENRGRNGLHMKENNQEAESISVLCLLTPKHKWWDPAITTESILSTLNSVYTKTTDNKDNCVHVLCCFKVVWLLTMLLLPTMT